MPAKTPIYLKTPTDRKGRRLKLRDILSGDMISPPLGDVRHSAHVGPQGLNDMFGDVAFLQGSMDILPSLSITHNGHEPSPQALSPQDPSISPLWSTACQEQAPPKPPRLHLDACPQNGSGHYLHQDTPLQNGPGHYPHLDTPLQNGPGHYPHLDTPLQNGPGHYPHLDTPLQNGPGHYPHLDTPLQNGPGHYPRLDTLLQNGPGHYPHQGTPLQDGAAHWPQHSDITLAQTIQQLVPSSGSSSEDSLFDTYGALDVPKGLSLDSDAGLSNEDLRSESSSSTFPRTDSILASLNLDLGPSILEDVLSIMDRYSVSPGT